MNKLRIAGFAELLTVAFIFLKLLPGTPVNSWSWWWVLSPLWIPLALAIVIIVVVMFASIVATVLSEIIMKIVEKVKEQNDK